MATARHHPHREDDGDPHAEKPKALGVDLAKALAGVAALATTLAALGKTTGVLDEMQRDHTIRSAIAIGLAILAGFVVAGGGLEDRRERQRWIFLSALALFLGALGVSLWTITEGRGERPPPNIDVALKSATKTAHASLVGSVTAEQMKSKQTLQVVVWAGGKRVYLARIGSDASGDVKLPFAVPVAASASEQLVKVIAWIDEKPEYCVKADLDTPIENDPDRPSGCVLVRLPPTPTG